MAKWLYAFKDPLGSGDIKIGITSNPRSRLGSYQCAYSAKRHKACFNYVWTGPQKQIDRLESVLKEQYKWDIASDVLGESEWVTDKTLEEIIQSVDSVIFGWKFHITPLEIEFPVTMDDVDYA
jgi:hypothetical protein